MKVNEVFYSIQGEGRNAGTPAVFIRLSGCNRSCSFCDTKDHSFGFNLDEEQIVRAALAYPVRNVIITGGEPTMQPLGRLVAELKAVGFWVAIETNGDLPLLVSFDWVTVSPKDPRFIQRHGDELKLVFQNEPSVESYIDENPDFRHYYLQPCSGKNIPEVIAYVKQNPRWKVSIQWQKQILIK